MEREVQVLRDVVNRLEAEGIRYMLTGSFALNYYAEPRMTRDIDLVVELNRRDGEKMLRSFQNDYYIDGAAVMRAIENTALFNIIHNEHVVKVDCILRKDNDYERLKFQRRQLRTVEGIALWIISKEDLIVSKLQWASGSHSEFQLRDVRNLLLTDYDADYVHNWAERLEVSGLLRECLHE